MYTSLDVKKQKPMYFEDVRQWQGTAEALTKELKRQIEQLGLSVESPALRTVRSWRAKQLLSQPKGQEFGFRQILEGLATTLLLKKGWTLAAIAQVLPTFTDLAIEEQMIAEANGQDLTWSRAIQTTPLTLPTGHRSLLDLAEDAIVLLAQGILRQYDRVLSGTEIVCQHDSMPPELYKATCKLGRLYIEEGQSCYAQTQINTPAEKADGSKDKLYNNAGLAVHQITTRKPFFGHWPTPNPLEIVVTLRQPGDNPDRLALLVESLRYSFGHYSDWTALPAPLFFERVVRDYISEFAIEDEDTEGEPDS
ncbi:RNaseH domain-containing protein [Iningainema tapete]|uniref:DUF3893 domain-containing protein n=1 Tax=Iningainema tapete BLCC-T55 TaxID=2748662 RepID=A0A8J6XP33_9CYAN|nr:RNaseH domain-containing protein [Iningainema tapete]MBD2776636.1 DUF3893 domain-containing protein [Iningainema tapete BLCC-T55]